MDEGIWRGYLKIIKKGEGRQAGLLFILKESERNRSKKG